MVHTLEKQRLSERAAGLGDRLLKAFRQTLGDLKGVADIRGLGLMIGIELDRPCSELVGHALDEGLLINVTADKVVRLLPPLVLSDEQADQLVDRLSPLIRKFLD